MSLIVPSQIRHGLSRTRTHLERNQEEIATCVADMAKNPDVDLTDELERLTADGDALRRKLAMYENAASVAVENQQSDHLEAWDKRKRELCAAAIEAAEHRTQWAENLDRSIESFKGAKQAYDEVDERARVALWQANTIDRPYLEAFGMSIDGSCRIPLLDEISNVLLRYHHEQMPSVAARAREAYVKSAAASVLREESDRG